MTHSGRHGQPADLLRVGAWFVLVAAFAASRASAATEPPFRKLGELELRLAGVSATAEPATLVVPKNLASGVRVVVRAGGVALSPEEIARFVGGAFEVQGELSGPGLDTTLSLPQPGEAAPLDPLLIHVPPLSTAGDYVLSGLRIVADGRVALDVEPRSVSVRVIDQVLVTSVQTRPLTLDEVRSRGIVLDSDAYLGFEFTLGMTLESSPVSFTFPVVFDAQGVPVPQPLLPPPLPPRGSRPAAAVPTIVPMLLEGEGPPGPGGTRPRIPLTTAAGEPIRVPSILVIPGDVGYLKQFFSAQLIVANGVPAGSGLTVTDVSGTIGLPPGDDREAGTMDDPLSLPATARGPQSERQLVLDIGPDGESGTGDDRSRLRAGEQGQAEFLIRGDREGFHSIAFDIAATLEGLPTGPVAISGRASGGVLVRNPYFDVAFAAPATVRQGERFRLFATVTNIGQGLGNDVGVRIDASRLSGARLEGPPRLSIDTLRPGDAATLAFELRSERTGQVVASYLHFDTQDGSTGELAFTLGVGERGVALSPDTLVLPSAVDRLPPEVVESALRVLGQAWSLASAPPGPLPQGVLRVSKARASEKVLALAEAGLRIELGAPAVDSVRDLLFDFHGPAPVDPGFDQLLRETEAGRAFSEAIGGVLEAAMPASGGATGFERESSERAAASRDLLAIGVDAASPVALTLVDAAGRRSSTDGPIAIASSTIVPLSPDGRRLLALVTDLTASPYTLELATPEGSLDVSVTLPMGDGRFARFDLPDLASGSRLTLDASRPLRLQLRRGPAGDPVEVPRTGLLESDGARLVSATVIGPEILAGSGPFGQHLALLFDRAVEATSAADVTHYAIPDNEVRVARRQLSGRLVLGMLAQPEGPYVPTELTVAGIRDGRGASGPSRSVSLASRLTDAGAVVSGRVVNADGSPVTNARVTYATNVDVECGGAPPQGVAAVDVSSQGAYEFRYVRRDPCGRPFGVLTQDPATGALRRASSYVRTAGEAIVLDLVLLGRGSVAGIVRDLQGKPVPGADVVVLSVADAQSGGATRTDGAGRYHVDGITVGQVTVSVSKGIFAGYSTGRIDRAGTLARVDVTMSSGSVRVSGTVRTLDAGQLAPVAGAQVRWYEAATLLGLATSDSTGQYAFEGMPAGAFTLQTALNTRDRASLSGVAAAGDVLIGRDLLIVIPPESEYGSLSGRVSTASGAPEPEAIVSVGDRATVAAADGSYVLPGIEARSGIVQHVVARARDGVRSGDASFVMNVAQTLTRNIALSGVGTAEFTVLGKDGSILAGVDVGLLGACADACGCQFKKTGPDGRVRFEGLPLGVATAQALQLGTIVDAARGSASISSDGAIGRAVLQFAGTGVVTGLVLDPDGAPALGAEVAIRSSRFVNDGSVCGLAFGVSHRIRTDVQGRFAVPRVNVGPIGVTAHQAFFPTDVGAQGNLLTAGSAVAFTLRLVNSTAGELSGRVLLPDGATPAGSGVEVTVGGVLPDVTVRTNESGAFRFARILPAGSYRLTARDPVTGGVVQERVFLRAGQDAVQDLRLKGKGAVRVRVVDGLDRPVASAYVKLAESEFPLRGYEAALSLSNDGVATFPGVFEGPFSAEAFDAQGRGGRASSVLAAPGSTQEVKVRLNSTGRVRGHFFERDGTKPIPYGIVTLRQADRVFGQVATLASGDIGAFSFDFVPAGTFEVTAQDPLSARTASFAGSLEEEGQVLEVRLVAQGLGTVQGSVVLNGAPRAAARVLVTSGTFRVATLTDGQGHYVVDGVPEGRVVAAANLGDGFLAGTGEGILAGDGECLILDVTLRGSGAVSGRVLRADGVTPAPPSSVRLNGAATQIATTGPDGSFRFDAVPVGRATLAADDLGSPDYGRGVVDVVESQTTSVDVRLNGLAAASVRVRDAHGQSVSGASVSLRAQSVAYGDASLTNGTTDDLGVAFFPEVLAGKLSADVRNPADGLTGSGTGPTAPDGASVTFDVALSAAGRLAGTVMNFDGSPHAGARVVGSLPGSARIVHADAEGAFAFETVRVGAFVLDVDTPEGDRARIAGSVAADATTRVEARLTGLGSVFVRVRNPDGSGASGVHVTATSGNRRQADTDAGGVAILGNLLAGAVTIDAFDPVRTSGARTTGTLAPGAVLDVGLELRPAGRVSGRVLGPDGTTPVAGALVSSGVQSAASDDAGVFELTNLPIDTDQVALVSVANRIRGVARFRLTVEAPDRVGVEIVLVGLGAVGGSVVDASGSAASSQVVRLQHPSPYVGGTFTATTDASGRYRFDAIPTGAFWVSADDGLGDRAEAPGQLDRHGQTLVVDLGLLSSAVAVPLDLDDANGFRFRVRPDGTAAGHEGLFGDGAPHWTVYQGDIALPFTGTGAMAASALERRELRLHQETGDLRLERRVYVPADGYFVRYLDIVTNVGVTTAALAIQEGIGLAEQLGGPIEPVSTSSGDEVVDVSDRYVVLDDRDGDWYARSAQAPHRPPLGIAAGTGGSVAPRLEMNAGRLVYQYDGLHLEPGGRAAVLHFIALQGDRSRALASVTRLESLPPEALIGLSPQDAAAIVNFAVPESLLSALEPLPPNDGFVSGRVLAGDGATTVSGAAVSLKSDSPYFGRPLAAMPLGDGSFAIRATDGASDGRHAVPRTGFALTAWVSQAGGQTTTTRGDFPSNGSIDLTSLAGRVLRASSSSTPTLGAVDRDAASAFRWRAGDVASPGAGTPFFEIAFPRDTVIERIRLEGATFLRARLEVRDAAGSVLWWQERNLIGGLDLTVPAIAHARAVRVVNVADLGAGAQFAELEVYGDSGGAPSGRTGQDVVFHGTGVIEARLVRSDQTPYIGGRIDATPFLTIDLRAAPVHRFLVVPPGPYILHGALAGDSHASVTRSIDVAPDQSTPVVLVLPALGTLQGQVSKADGSAATASLTVTGTGGDRSMVAHGVFAMTDLVVGDYEIRASRSPLTLFRSLSIPEHQVAIADFTFPPFGRLSTSVTSGGQPLPDAIVSWSDGPSNGSLGVCTTTSAGVCTMEDVTGAPIRVRARHPRSPFITAETSAAIASEGQQVSAGLELPQPASASGVVRRPDGTPAANAVIRVRLEDGTLVTTLAADSTGAFLAPNLPPGALLIQTGRPTHPTLAFTEMPLRVEAGQNAVASLEIAGAVRAPEDKPVFRILVPSGDSVAATALGVAEGSLPALASPQVTSFQETAGSVLLAVRGPGGQTGAFQLVVPGGRAVRLPEGRIEGRVQLRPGLAGASGQPVRITCGHFVRHVAADSAGRFVAESVPGGSALVEAIDLAGVVLGSATALVAEPGTSSVEIQISARAAVHVSVTRGGLPVAGQDVHLETNDPDAPEGDRHRVVTTDVAGRVDISLPAGLVRVSLVDPVTGAPFEQNGSVEPGGDLELHFALPQIAATLRGTILLGGGVPASGADVTLSGVGATRAGEDGAYAFVNVPAATTTVTASLGGSSRSETVTLMPGEERVVDLVLPGAALYGRILEPTSEPVVDATVRACGPDDSFTVQSCVTTTTDGNGGYILAGLPHWRFCATVPSCNNVTITVTALVGDGSGLTASVARPFNHTQPGARNQDLVLPETGSVAGTVRESSGDVAAGADVRLPDGRQQTTDAMGRFEFLHVRPGQVRVHAESAGDRLPGLSEWAPVEARRELRLDVGLAASGTLEGTLVDEAGAPLERQARVVVLEAPTPSARWSRVVSTAPDGSFSLKAPAGPYRIVFEGDYAPATCRNDGPAAVESVLEAAETQTSLLTRGSHIVAGILSGPLGAYGEADDCSGHRTASPALRTDVNGVEYEHVVAAEAEGRAHRYLRESVGGLEVRKQEYVPSSGAFVRTLTVVRNTTALPIDAPLASLAELPVPPVEGCPGGPAWVLLETSSGDAVLDENDSFAIARPNGPGLAMGVVAGEGLQPGAASFVAGEQDYAGDGCTEGSTGQFRFVREWSIPAGATRALLTFSVSRAPDDASLAAQMRALATLDDPDALTGLTADDRRAIVNFAIPGQTRLGGRVETSLGARAGNAQVVLMQAGTIVDRTTAAADGEFAFQGLDAGDYVVVASDAGRRPGRAVADVANGQEARLLVRLPADDELGTVVVQVTGTSSIEGVQATLTLEGYSPAWQAVGLFDAQGRVTFQDVPAGRVRVALEEPLDRAFVEGDHVPPAATSLALVLVPSGTVTGLVLDDGGAPVAGAAVGVHGDGGFLDRGETNAEGRFSLTVEPPGTYRVEVYDPVSGRPGSMPVTVLEAQTTEVTVVLAADPELATLDVTGVSVSTGDPAPGLPVLLSAPGSLWTALGTLDEFGRATFQRVPPTAVAIAVGGGEPDDDTGFAWVLPRANLRADVVVPVGLRGAWPVDLTGADLQPYFARGNSVVEASGSGDDWLCRPFCAGWSQFVVGESESPFVYSQWATAGITQAGREASLGPEWFEGLRLSRRVFVPPSGRFVRVLDVLENTTDAPLPVGYYLEQAHNSSAGAWQVTRSSSGDSVLDASDAFAVVESLDPDSPAMAWVRSGPNAAAAATDSVDVVVEEPWTWLVARGRLTLPPYGRAVLVRFTLQRPNGEADAAYAAAATLADLTDPEALLGVSQPERDAIVNFSSPGSGAPPRP